MKVFPFPLLFLKTLKGQTQNHLPPIMSVGPNFHILKHFLTFESFKNDNICQVWTNRADNRCQAWEMFSCITMAHRNKIAGRLRLKLLLISERTVQYWCSAYSRVSASDCAVRRLRESHGLNSMWSSFKKLTEAKLRYCLIGNMSVYDYYHFHDSGLIMKTLPLVTTKNDVFFFQNHFQRWRWEYVISDKVKIVETHLEKLP